MADKGGGGDRSRDNPSLEEFFGVLAGNTAKANDSAVKPFITVGKELEKASKELNKSAMNMAALGKTSQYRMGMDMDALGQHAASRRAKVTGTIPMAQSMGAPMATVTGTVMGPTAARAMAALGSLGTAAAAVTGPLIAVASAGAAAAAALGTTVMVARHFTQAFDPSAVQSFDAIMRDLQAVIGSMMVPIVTEATRVIRQFASVLYASSGSIGQSIGKIAKAFGDVFVAFMPIISQLTVMFADVLVNVAEYSRAVADFLIPQIRALVTIMAGWADTFKAILSGIFPALGGNFKNALVQAAQTVGKMAVAMQAVIFKLFGMKDALAAMVGSLQDGADKALQRDASGLAAAQNARMMAVSGLGNEILQRAFVTSGRVGQDSEEISDAQYRKELLDLVNDIKAFDIRTLPRMIGEAVADALLMRQRSPSETNRSPVPPGITYGVGGMAPSQPPL